MKTMLQHLLLMFFTILMLGSAHASDKNPFRVETTDLTLGPGQKGNITVTVVVPKDHHVYRDMMHVKTLENGGLTVGEASFPPGHMKPDPANPEAQREMYDLDVIIEVPVEANKPAGTYEVYFEVAYQGCRKTLCWMPQREEHSSKVTISGAAAAPAVEPPSEPTAAEAAFVVTPGQGEPGQAVVSVDLKEPWHINRDFLAVRLASESSAYTLGELDAPAGEAWTDPNLGITRMDLVQDFAVKVPVDGPSGETVLDLLVTLQVCKDILCKMPEDVAVSVAVVVSDLAAGVVPPKVIEPKQVQPSPTGGPTAEASGDAFSKAKDAGVVPLLLVVFAAGLGISLTPCVLPMVPITIGIIGARSAGSRAHAIALSTTYVAGMALVYSALGVAAGITGMMFGAWMQSVWVVGAISLFFVVMGAAMFGLFDVGMPSAIQTRLSQVGGSGFGGAFLIGMVGALVAGPCSGPVLLSIIALIGQQGEAVLGAMLMGVFSLGMGMIFIVAGAFSSAILRPGPWMETVKKSFGIVMWVGAIYFAAPHMSQTMTALVTAAMLLITGVFAWPAADSSDGFMVARSRQLYSIGGGLVGAYLLVGVLVTRGFILPPMSLGSVATSASTESAIVWGSDEASALATAKAEGKPVIVDFTADWCAACKELEHFTYTDPAVIAASEGMIPVMIDATNDKDPRVKALLDKYEVRGLPTVKFLHPDGTPMDELTVTGFLPAEDFLPVMEKALTRVRG